MHLAPGKIIDLDYACNSAKSARKALRALPGWRTFLAAAGSSRPFPRAINPTMPLSLCEMHPAKQAVLDCITRSKTPMQHPRFSCAVFQTAHHFVDDSHHIGAVTGIERRRMRLAEAARIIVEIVAGDMGVNGIKGQFT